MPSIVGRPFRDAINRLVGRPFRDAHCSRQIEWRRRLVQLVEPATAEMRDHDCLERGRPRQECPRADETHSESRLAAPLHQKARQVDRIDDVGRLKLVETAPHEARRSRTEVEVARDDIDE